MLHTILFIDSNIADYEALLAGLANDAEVHVLNDTEDGVLQMAAILQGHSALDSIQILSHGSRGNLYLGSGILNSDSLTRYAAALTQIGSALSENGDILLYGCNVAEGDAGVHFISNLAQYTGADVTASDDLTGSSALGGDWDLEKHVGNIETGLTLADAARASYAHTLSTATFGFDSATVIDQGASVEETVNGVKVTASTDSSGLGLSGNQLFDTSNQGTYLQLQFSRPVDVSSFSAGFWTNSGTISSFTIEGYVSAGITPSYTYSATLGYSELWTGSNSILPPYTVDLSGGNDWGMVDSIKVTVNPVGAGTVHVGFVADNITFSANTAPVITSAGTGSVAENASANVVIYTVTSTDADAGDTLSFSLKAATGDEALMDINAATGEVTLKSSADFETKADYSFTVVSTDAGGLSAEQAVLVSVSNVNEAPVLTPPTAITYTDTIFDDAFATAQGTLAAGDIDGDALSYGIEGGTDNGDGTISAIGTYGTLTVTKATGAYGFAADAAAIQALTVNAGADFKVTASDAALSSSETLTINMTQQGSTESLGNDTLSGTSGMDKFDGLAGYDYIKGWAGADTIKGGLGEDTLFGGAGDDVQSGEDGNDVLWGVFGDNTLNGGAGNDMLISGKGHNLLTGDSGMDMFRFISVSHSTITDFVIADDTIQLENRAFSHLSASGVLAVAHFATGAAAADADDYIVYNNSTGKLYYDADGSGAGAARQIAVLGVNLDLTNADFIIT
ncbi:MAG: DUF4347 domain-containing protein [Methylococcaceae bacterium]